MSTRIYKKTVVECIDYVEMMQKVEHEAIYRDIARWDGISSNHRVLELIDTDEIIYIKLVLHGRTEPNYYGRKKIPSSSWHEFHGFLTGTKDSQNDIKIICPEFFGEKLEEDINTASYFQSILLKHI